MQLYKFVFSLVPPDETAADCWTKDPHLKQCFVEIEHGDEIAGWGKVTACAILRYPGYKVIPRFAFPRDTAQPD